MEEPRSYQTISYNDNGTGNLNNGRQVYALPLLQSQSNVEEEQENIDLRQLLTVVKHRMRLIITVALGVTAAAGVWTLAQQSRYQGGFQLLVGDPTTEENQLERSPIQGLGKSNEIDYKTQIEVLRSPSVLGPIIQQLAQKYPDIEYGALILGKNAPLQISQLKDTQILDISYQNEDPKKIQFVLEKLAEAYLNYSLEERQMKINQGLDFVENQLPELYQRVDALQEKLQKFRQKHNFLNPEEQAKDVSEQLLALEEKNFEAQVKLKENRTTYGLLQKQLGLQPEEAAAASYLSESERYQKLLNQLQEVEVELTAKSAIWQENSPIIQELQLKKQNLLPLLNKEAQTVLGRDFSPGVSNTPALSSPSSLRLDLNQKFIEATNEIEVLEVRQKALTQGIKELNAKIEQMPVIARQFTDLQRQLNVATESLTRFLAAQEKLQLEAAQQALPWQLIAKPELPEVPIFPKPSLILTMGALGGLLLGLGAALLAERLDPVFHSAEELKESLQIPILGFIPLQKELKTVEEVVEISLPQLQVGNTKVSIASSGSSEKTGRTAKSDRQRQGGYASSSFLEAFRSLNTNIRLLGSDSPINSVVISSSAPAEGKSTVSTHLAQAAAAMGQRVLLIDADLRRPQVHHRLGLENQVGLSNIIATGVDLRAAIQKVPQWENLSVLTAGDIPPDPTRLLSSVRMQQFMEQVQKLGWFDLIIYDTPPILGFADGKILAASTTGIILVAKMGKTDRGAFKQTVDELKMSRVPILGLVANGVNRHGKTSYYYYDRYYKREPGLNESANTNS